jgi:hypothetical protein
MRASSGGRDSRVARRPCQARCSRRLCHHWGPCSAPAASTRRRRALSSAPSAPPRCLRNAPTARASCPLPPSSARSAPRPWAPRPTPPRFASPVAYTPTHLAERIRTSKDALEGERKHVTVLFADLKGSCGLTHTRDMTRKISTSASREPQPLCLPKNAARGAGPSRMAVSVLSEAPRPTGPGRGARRLALM